MKKSMGFTLIELLLVLAIIGIISAIAIASLLNQREKAMATVLKDQTVSVVGDLTSVVNELADPPSERKTAYPTTHYGSLAADNLLKAQDAISIVLARTNFASARNPYMGGGAAYLADVTPTAGGGTLGVVYVDAATASTTLDPVITVSGVFRNSQGNIQHLTKSVAVN